MATTIKEVLIVLTGTIVFIIAYRLKDKFLRRMAYDEVCIFFERMDITVLEAKQVSQLDWVRMGVSTMQMALDLVIQDQKDGKIQKCRIIFGGIFRGPWHRKLEIFWEKSNSGDIYYL
jgi:hypothetical protein